VNDGSDNDDVPPDLPSHPSTSIEAYHDMEDSGELARRRAAAEKAFFTRDAGTIREVLHSAGLDRNLNLMRARTTELKQSGTILEIERRPCKITRRRCGVYRWVPPDQRVLLPSLSKKSAMILELCLLLESFLDNPDIFTEAKDAEQMRAIIIEARAMTRPKAKRRSKVL
jgi:hypothetical protein